MWRRTAGYTAIYGGRPLAPGPPACCEKANLRGRSACTIGLHPTCCNHILAAVCGTCVRTHGRSPLCSQTLFFAADWHLAAQLGVLLPPALTSLYPCAGPCCFFPAGRHITHPLFSLPPPPSLASVRSHAAPSSFALSAAGRHLPHPLLHGGVGPARHPARRGGAPTVAAAGWAGGLGGRLGQQAAKSSWLPARAVTVRCILHGLFPAPFHTLLCSRCAPAGRPSLCLHVNPQAPAPCYFRSCPSLKSLRTSRVAPIYNTVAPSLGVFATLFGKALQAQVGRCTTAAGGCGGLSLCTTRACWLSSAALSLAPAFPANHANILQARIAMVNTILTALGMWALQIPGVGLLSLFVFICGFIPIVSSTYRGSKAHAVHACRVLPRVTSVLCKQRRNSRLGGRNSGAVVQPASASSHLALSAMQQLTGRARSMSLPLTQPRYTGPN